jgi:hypothetical protein
MQKFLQFKLQMIQKTKFKLFKQYMNEHLVLEKDKTQKLEEIEKTEIKKKIY